MAVVTSVALEMCHGRVYLGSKISMLSLHSLVTVLRGFVNMGPMPLDKTRCIRNIQIIKDDLRPLLPDATQRIPSTPINSYGTLLQQHIVDAERASFVFISSLVLVYAAQSSQQHDTMFLEHLEAAVRIFTSLSLPLFICYTGWPQHSTDEVALGHHAPGSPDHWVLGWPHA